MIYLCCNEHRREAVRPVHILKGIDFNGIDYLEVPDAHTLKVHFIHPLVTERTRALHTHALSKENVSITGGERIRDVAVVKVNVGEPSDILIVKLNKPGDRSTYTLLLKPDPHVLKLDPQLSEIDFNFNGTESIDPHTIDCKTDQVCQPELPPTPEIDYLARDFASFRQLMLDRLTLLMPRWNERSVADIGVMLVEILAYVGDHLSYQQDVIATESYLSTARRRISIRRHARLLDYFISEGCNARVWVQVQVNQDMVRQPGDKESPLPQGTGLLTKVVGQDATLLTSSAYEQATGSQAPPEVFETMYDADGLFRDHNELSFYTWGARECCLPKGATHATLLGRLEHLQPGDILIFKEVLGAHTGAPEDAEPGHRHAVRLTSVTLTQDPLGTWSTQVYAKGEKEPDYSLDITEIERHYEDALPFPLCISATTDYDHGHKYLEKVSVALGNIVLADHGRTQQEIFAPVPPGTTRRVSTSGDRCDVQQAISVAPRFYPSLTYAPLTYTSPYDASNPPQSASATMRLSAHNAAPAIILDVQSQNTVISTKSAQDTLAHSPAKAWLPKGDLLRSKGVDRHFVVESDGTSFLRFGDDQHGLRPREGDSFLATYRIGNGVHGNIGAEGLYHIVSNDTRIKGVSNPLAALGGVEPESIEDVRQKISRAFSTQERGVTPADYKEIAERHPQISKANALLRWTGSWYTVFLVVERVRGMPVDDAFKHEIRQYMESFRMAGGDLEIVSPVYVPLEIEMAVIVEADYFRNNVKAALLEVFSNRQWPDGERGVFYPGMYSFGQSVYLNPLLVAATGVPGVATATIITFQRQGIPGSGLADGVLALDWLEIARLDNDPGDPERGTFLLNVRDGK